MKEFSAFAREFEKIAAEAKPRKRSKFSTGESLALGGTFAVPLAANVALGQALKKSKSYGTITVPEVKELLTSMGVKKEVDVITTKYPTGGAFGRRARRGKKPVINPETGKIEWTKRPGSKYVIMGPTTHPEVLAHEAGHASRYLGKTNLSKVISRLAGTPLFSLGALAGLGMAALPDDDKSKLIKAAPAVAAATALPLLVEEASASVRGMKALKKTKRYSGGALRGMKGNLLKAFGTYGAAAMLGIAPAAYIAHVRGQKAKKKEKGRAG